MVETRLSKSILLTFGIIVLSLQDVLAYGGKSKSEGGLITQCEYPGTKGIFVSTKKYTYENATTTCGKLGGSLVDLTNQNILLASDILLTCVGPNSKAWVGSWDYKDNFEPSDGVNDCLSLVVSNIGPSGTISKICKGTNYLLCQNHDSPVEHNPLYTQPAWSSASYSPLPTRDSGVADIIDEDDKEYPVYYPKQAAGAYPPSHDEAGTFHQAFKPVYYPRPDYDTPGQTNKPAYYPKPAAGGNHKGAWKQHRYPMVIEPANEEDCETWTLNGVVTTITKQPTSTSAPPSSSPPPTSVPTLSEETTTTTQNTLNPDDATDVDAAASSEEEEEEEEEEESSDAESPSTSAAPAVKPNAAYADMVDGNPAQLEQIMLADREKAGEAP